MYEYNLAQLFEMEVVRMNINDIIRKKRDCEELETEEIKFFVREYSYGNIPDYQVSALLMAIYLNGMSQREISDLTIAMSESGDVLNLSEIEGIKVDKHSTGGIGDKVTMVVMPLVAACGVPVAKMSGRGLGYTQGTIDKLESIEGFRTDLDLNEFIENVKEIGISLMSQSQNIAVADKKLYALRDVTATVESIPLIASSVMSKKIAAGADKILLEVTCGTGSFMENESRARILAETMVNIGKMVDRETVAVMTNMNQPLGRYCGNALETMEAIQTLKGKGESDVIQVCSVLGAYMLKMAGKGENIVNNMKLIQSKIESGEGLNKLRELIERQGGNTEVIDKPELLMRARVKIPVEANENGYIYEIDAKNIGQAVVNIGGGRLRKEDSVDHFVGVEVLKKIGDKVNQGDILMYIHANDDTNARKEVTFLRDSFKYADRPVPKIKEILDVIE